MAFLKAIWRSNSKHKKLCEEWALQSCNDLGKEPPPDGVTFVVKYLGSALVETPSNETATAEAIKTIITMAKASGKKVQRVTLTVSLQGIKMVDLATEETHLDVSIYRISYCSADATYDHVFAFIATNSNETMECHAFLCPKRKMAHAVTLAIAQTFNTAYELWQMSENTKLNENDIRQHMEKKKLPVDIPSEEEKDNNSTEVHNQSNKSLLIDLSSEPLRPQDNGNTWVSFEDDREERIENIIHDFAQFPNNQSPAANIQVVQNNSRNSSGRPWGDSRSIDLLCS